MPSDNIFFASDAYVVPPPGITVTGLQGAFQIRTIATATPTSMTLFAVVMSSTGYPLLGDTPVIPWVTEGTTLTTCFFGAADFAVAQDRVCNFFTNAALPYAQPSRIAIRLGYFAGDGVTPLATQVSDVRVSVTLTYTTP